MKSANDNEAITKLPILLFARKDSGEGWIAASEPALVHGESVRVLKRYPVRVVPANALAQFAHPSTRAVFEATYGRIPEAFSQQLLPMLGIAGAIRKSDLKTVAMLAERAANPTGKLAAAWAKLNAVVTPWDKVAATLNTGLFGIMPVLWQREAQLAPALFCQTPQMALFAHALFTVTSRHGLRVCRRCGNPFFALRDNHSSCGYKCRVAQAMKRYRRNLKRGRGKSFRRTKR
jgi:hypothetical protein